MDLEDNIDQNKPKVKEIVVTDEDKELANEFKE